LSRDSDPAPDLFVFDTVDRGLVFIPIAEAQRLALLNDALADASTWGEFLSDVANDVDTSAYLGSQYGKEPPGAGEEFDPADIPGFLSGDWPTWPKRAMLSNLPASVRALGIVGDSLLNGFFLHLDEDNSDEIVEAMRLEGLECVQDSDDLVVRACGIWQ
jgi:hypothetical protein